MPNDPNDHLKHEKSPSRFERLHDFVTRRFLSIVFVIAILLVAFAMFGPADPEVPRWAKLGFLVFLFILPYGFVAGNYIVSLLYNPEPIFVLDLDAQYIDGALYEFPPSKFRDLEVTDGNLCQLGSHLYTGKEVDPDNMTVTGTWRGTLDDRELLRALTAVHECRNMLEQDAKRGFAIETQAFSIIRRATRDAVLRVVETFESGSLPDEGASVNNAVDDAIDRYDLDKRINRLTEDDTDVADKDLEGVEPNEFDPEGDLNGTDQDVDLVDPTEQTEATSDD